MMKGVILTINPGATIVDLTHQVQPQNLQQASFILGASHRFFPPGAIHLVVVDPGVGTGRRALLLTTPIARFLAPDNGILSGVLGQLLEAPPTEACRVPVPSGCAAFELTNPQYWRPPVSDTFHGRDIFAPVAAHLSLGVAPEELGQAVADLAWLPAVQPQREGRRIRGEVIYTDHFGNLITNIPAEWLVEAGQTDELRLEIKGRIIPRLSRTFHDDSSQSEEDLLALIGSHGYLEIARRDGSAALALSVAAGEPVLVSFQGSGGS
jgi:hypothetical protein